MRRERGIQRRWLEGGAGEGLVGESDSAGLGCHWLASANRRQTVVSLRTSLESKRARAEPAAPGSLVAAVPQLRSSGARAALRNHRSMKSFQHDERKLLALPRLAEGDRKDRWRLVDFCVCWLTLGNLLNALAALAFFKGDIVMTSFGSPITTSGQRIARIAASLAIASCGLVYMGWRQQWRFGLREILTFTVWLCLVCAVLVALPRMTPGHAPYASIALAASQIVFAAGWAYVRGRAPKPVSHP
jgi:hypothetical protein